MIELKGAVAVDDYLLVNGMDIDDLQRMIKQQMASSLIKELANHKEFQKTIVKREGYHPLNFDRTVYETRVIMLTPEEAREYKQLKEFQQQMKSVILSK